MSNLKGILLLVLCTTFAACSSSSSRHITAVDTPSPRSSVYTEPYMKEFSELEPNSRHQTFSIGDLLFSVKRARMKVQVVDLVTYTAPTNVEIPKFARWIHSHSYKDESQKTYKIYTTKDYYSSDVGVILDPDLMPVTTKPLIQVDGAREGRRWEISGQGKFFKPTERTILIEYEHHWGLRFGGKTNEGYIFEIINKAESRQFEILQRLVISENDFLSGFSVRKVFVKGLKPYRNGVITAEFNDTYQIASNNL